MQPSSTKAAAGVGRPLKDRLSKIPPVVFVLVAELIIFSLITPDFARPSNLISILVQASPLAILSLGAAVVIISRGIDLSSGMLFTLAMSVSAVLLVRGVPWPLALLAGLIVAMLGGLYNGFFVSYVGIPPFLTTLSLFGLAHGIALGITELGSVAIDPGPVYFLGEGAIVGIPFPILLTLLVFLLCQALMYKTPFGIYVYAIGSNREAASLSGVNVKRWNAAVYVLGATLSGLTGMVMLGRMHAAHPMVGTGWEFDAIAAAVIGGISMDGGRGRLYAALIGALFIVILRNGMNFMGLSTYWQTLAKGVVILVAIVLDTQLTKRRANI